MARLFLIVNFILILSFTADADSSSSSSASASSSSDGSLSSTSFSRASACCPRGKKPVKCKDNEEFSNCTQTLGRRLKCSQQGKPLRCAKTPKRCRSGCVCQPGFLKTANGICVPETQCYGDLVCKDTEVVNTCPNYSFSDYCPTSEEDAQLETKVVSTPCSNDPECTCRFNYKRLQNGTCTPIQNCPPFKCSGKYQEYNPCPPLCPSDDCSQATPTGRCPLGRIGIILTCRPTCRCIPGYWKNKGVCVPYAECPGKCPSNEELSSCAQGICRAENCTQKGQPIPCPDIEEGSCEERCVCVEGTLRDANGICIPEDKCPVPTCGENEAFAECPNGCSPVGCPKSYKEERARLADCIAPAVCLTAECRCLPDYRRDSSGKCIYIGECPGICPKNEEFSNCTQASGRAQNCAQSQSIASPVGSCEPGCICKKGMLRDANGICVPENKCPALPTCGENEAFVECPNGCTPVGCPKSYKEERARLADCIAPAVCLTAECRCLPDYRRDSSGKCIYIGKCPGICPKNEEFANCIQASGRAQNCTQSQSIGSPEGSCEPGCICKEGMLKDANGICVSEDKCPAPPTCGENEAFVECPNGCTPVGCPKSYKEERATLADCVAPAVCLTAECRCLPDYRRDSSGKCIYIGECPGICPKNEEFSNCIQASGRAQNCTQSQSIASTEGSCEPGCICKEGMLRDDNGICVSEDKCPAPPQLQCGQNEILSCVHDCPPEATCKSRASGIQYRCREPTKLCEDKCVCKPDYYRNAIGECITGKECDKCKGYKEFFSCGVECDNECSKLATQNRTNCPIVNIVCNPKCYCEDDFARDEKNQCIPVEKCPKTLPCKLNEEYVKCKRTCPPELCFSIVARFDCPSDPPCIPGCACKPGYLRKEDNSPCVSTCDCPEMENSPDCAKIN